MRRLTLVALLLVAMAPGSPAFAHTGFGNLSGAGFGAGFVHPLGGLDHILAMVAVGLLGVGLGGRAIWGLPLTFLATMAVGALLGITGGYLRLVEIGIALSIIVFGALAALQRPMPLVAAMVIVGGFAIFHGHAHGAEAPATAAPALFALGFVLATGILHALGVAAGLANRPLMRAGGAAIAAIGTFVLVAG
jgi:urease accessory protein